MTETFKCSSCSAPLEFEGTPIQECKFCGSSVIVPAEAFGRTLAEDQSNLTGLAQKIAEIRDLIASGNKLMAIKVFRETFGSSLEQAKAAVDTLESGAGVDLSGISVKTVEPMDQKDVEAVKKFGYTVGGSILLMTGLILLFVGCLVGAIFYFTYWTVDKAIGTAVNTATTPRSTPEASIAREILRIGGDGTGAGRFKDNRHVAVDPFGRIYSMDFSGGFMQVFDKEGKFITQWMTKEDVAVRALAVDRKGNVIIADVRGLAVYDGQNGTVLRRNDKSFIDDLAVSPEGRIFAVGRDGISILDADLKPQAEFKDVNEKANAKGGFRSIAVDGRGPIYLVDKQKNDICKFSPDGKFLNRISSRVSSPNAIAVDPNGRIYVAGTSQISVFDDGGILLANFPAKQAFGMAFDDAGDLYVASRPFVVKYKLTF